MKKTQSYREIRNKLIKQAFYPNPRFNRPMPTPDEVNKYNQIYNPSPAQRDQDVAWNRFNTDVSQVFSDPRFKGFEVPDADMMRYDQEGYNQYGQHWPTFRTEFYKRNDEIRQRNEANLRSFYNLKSQYEQKLGRPANDTEMQNLVKAYDVRFGKKYGPNAGSNALAYAKMRQAQKLQGNAVSGGDTHKGQFHVSNPSQEEIEGRVNTDLDNFFGDLDNMPTQPKQDPKWYSGIYNWMQNNPNLSAGMGALLSGGLLYGLGAGTGKKRNHALGLILALLGGGATYYGMNRWLTPSQAPAGAAQTTA